MLVAFWLLLKTEHMGRPWNNESAEKWWACGRHVRQKELAQGIQNQDLMDKKRVDVAVRDQKSTSGRVWARMVHSMPTRKSPALDADVEAAARLV
jgi:hypothetical protein